MFSRRHTRGWIALLLPLMLLRAMLPAGFMPVAADGELRIVMCSAGLDIQGDHDRRDGGTPDQQAQQANCLFAHAATLAPPEAIRHLSIASPTGFDIAATARRPLPTRPYRFAAARGPPRYS